MEDAVPDSPNSVESPAAPQAETGTERRRDLRLHCLGLAEVNLINGYSLCEGRVHNLSSSGCRIWCTESLDLLPGCEIEVVLDVDGIRFRVLGALRSEDENGFGVEFLELSPRCRQYIDDLIRELAFYQHPSTPASPPPTALAPDPEEPAALPPTD